MFTYLVDNSGFIYSAELGGRDDQISASKLAIGEKVKGWVSFSIPENATPVSVKYSTEMFVG